MILIPKKFKAANLAISEQGILPSGWSVVLDDSGIVSDGCGLDYVLDLVSELELPPGFPVSKSGLLKTGNRKQISEVDHHVSQPNPNSPTRPQVSFPSNLSNVIFIIFLLGTSS